MIYSGETCETFRLKHEIRLPVVTNGSRIVLVQGTGRRATRFTVIVAVLIWVLAVICAIPATFSYLRPFHVNKNMSFQVRPNRVPRKSVYCPNRCNIAAHTDIGSRLTRFSLATSCEQRQESAISEINARPEAE